MEQRKFNYVIMKEFTRNAIYLLFLFFFWFSLKMRMFAIFIVIFWFLVVV